MQIKRSLAAVAITGATAAVLFGGTTVSTAFTSNSDTQHTQVSGATTGVRVSGGNINVANLVPGDPAKDAGAVTIINDSSVPAVPSITLSAANITHNGTTTAPDLSKLAVKVGPYSFTQSQIKNGGTFSLPAMDAHSSRSYPVTVALAQGTGNDWNGAVVQQDYIVTMTAGK